MKPAYALALLVAWSLCAACSHARDVEREGSASMGQSQLSAVKDAPRPVGTTPKSVFTRDATKAIQSALIERGYPLKMSGKLDEPTRVALIAFQRQEDLAPTGMPDRETMRRLDLDPETLLKKGSTTAK